MKRFITTFSILSLIILSFNACDKIHQPGGTELDKETAEEYKYANTFLYNAVSSLYLWIDDANVAKKVADWNSYDNPIESVQNVLHPNDRWTMAVKDINSMYSYVSGDEYTYGYDCTLYWFDSSQTSVVAVITLVYPQSPAERAGLKRGDVVIMVNGKQLLADNYVNIINKEFFNSSEVSFTLYDGREISLTAVSMYEDPVLCKKVLEVGGKKYGYLMYNKFTEKSIPDLIELSREFREAEVDELILDMRYNGGGYVSAELVLASLLAPKNEVSAGSVFHTSCYNERLTETLGAGEQPFIKSVTYDDIEYDLLDANMGISKIYAILTENSASASEGVLVGLMPYIDVTIVGEQSHGKYCTGSLIAGKDWFDDIFDEANWTDHSQYVKFTSAYSDYKKYIHDWGIYVMYARFADKNGQTPCMPNGFAPDVYVIDCPKEGYDFGSENESMLKAVIGDAVPGASLLPSRFQRSGLDRTPYQHISEFFGVTVDNR